MAAVRGLIYLAALLPAALAAGCAPERGSSPELPARASVSGAAMGNPVRAHVKHVVVIIQENRSFENFFAGFPGANAPMEGSA